MLLDDVVVLFANVTFAPLIDAQLTASLIEYVIVPFCVPTPEVEGLHP